MKRALHILGYWLWIGFTGGALVLLLIATPLEHFLRDHQTPQAKIDFVMAGIAILWVFISFIAALVIDHQVHSIRFQLTAHVVGIVLCGAIFTLFLQAGAGGFSSARAEEAREGRFLFGPYPDDEACQRLKREGYEGVITLLDPFVPFEAVLLEKERAMTHAAGLLLIEIPMLPWISENRTSLDTLKTLGATGSERYYVHCYLGRHRVDLARATLLAASGTEVTRTVLMPEKFERDHIRVIDQRIFIGPLPTEEEWFLYIGRSGIEHVVSLLSPETDRLWADEERRAARDLGINVHFLSVSEADSFIRRTDGMIYVHSFRLDARTEKLTRMLSKKR